MKLIYTDSNRFLVSNAKNVVENAGIPVTLKNEYATGAVGELSPIDSWLELWVSNDEDYEKARKLLESIVSADDKVNWVCTHCDEKNDASFDFCWNCQTEKG